VGCGLAQAILGTGYSGDSRRLHLSLEQPTQPSGEDRTPPAEIPDISLEHTRGSHTRVATQHTRYTSSQFRQFPTVFDVSKSYGRPHSDF